MPSVSRRLSLDEKVRLLKKVNLFFRLPPRELRRIAGITRSQEFPEGTDVISENERGDRLFIIVAGKVKIFRTASSGRARKTLAVLGRSDFFGEMAILNHETRSASVETLSNVHLLYIARGDFNKLVRRDPDVAACIMATLASRLRDADRQISTLTFQNLLGRVAVCLCDLTRKHGVKKSGGAIEIGLDLTQQELADMVGTAREVVTKVLSRLRSTTAIKLEGRRITILDLPKLKSWIY